VKNLDTLFADQIQGNESRYPHLMDKKSSVCAAFLLRRVLFTVLLCLAGCLILTGTIRAFVRSESITNATERSLTFAERVAWQRAIENVYWRHRIWPRERIDPKPSLDAVMSQAQLRKKVADYLHESEELENYRLRPITAQELQTEMDRMARDTKRPEVLRELFEALGNDPFVIAECLARPVLSERLMTSLAQGERKCGLTLSEVGARNQAQKLTLANAIYTLPQISDVAGGGCTPDTWTPTNVPHAPPGRLGHAAIWTGTEMIVWGGYTRSGSIDTGGRYNPITDSWIKTSDTNAPDPRVFHTVVWTGNEMIVWGGCSDLACYDNLNTGGRYNPSTDTWTAISTTNAPEARRAHTAVWTGSEMIVWGGETPTNIDLNTGGRYDPHTDEWTATSTTGAPTGRLGHTAVWAGSEMIVWGGVNCCQPFNTGGKYNPSTDSWTATNTTNAPAARWAHIAVWTGSEMIVWGGFNDTTQLNTGGRYDPSTDSWTTTSTINAPERRTAHTAVWTGSEMIIWGGVDTPNEINTGARYSPDSDSWTATTTTDAPSARSEHTAVWTGSEMIIWGGTPGDPIRLNTGGRYCAQSGSPTPTATPTATATATPTATITTTPTPTPTSTVSPTPTATARPSPTPRIAPTPRPRPTPPPRP
jgi:N-acetylneuraminic acid mutarotase